MKRIAAALCLVVAGLLQGQEVRRAIPLDRVSADDTAKFLAGVSLPSGSPLASLQQTSEYAHHVSSLARLSQRYNRQFFSLMREWSAVTLAAGIPMGLPVYYFFSGPDAVSVMALYPDAPVYILGGLEPVGQIPSPLLVPRHEIAAGLANLRKSTEVILSFGHFITKDMKAELDRTAFRGVLPLIYTFIALTGGEVLGFHEFTVGGSPGVKIEFRRAGGTPVQAIYYLQANVADDGLKSGGLLGWAQQFGRGNVYLKAASYLLHEPYFSRMRTFLLGQGVSVLQDDSGIPFRFFRDGGWRIQLFGVYAGTLDIFAKYYQPDLHAAFSSPGIAAPLPFGTGYKWRQGESNLLLATRQQIPRATPALP